MSNCIIQPWWRDMMECDEAPVGRVADHAWDFDAAYLSGGLLVDLGEQTPLIPLIPNNALDGNGNIYNTNVTYGATTIKGWTPNGTNRSWNSSIALESSKLSKEFTGELIFKFSETGGSYDQTLFRIGDVYYWYETVNLSINNSNSLVLRCYQSYASTVSVVTSSVLTVGQTYHILFGLNATGYAWVSVNGAASSIAATNINALASSASLRKIGTGNKHTSYWLKNNPTGGIGLWINKTPTDAQKAERDALLLSGSVGNLRLWSGL